MRPRTLLRQKGRRGGDVELFAKLPDELLRSDAVRTLPYLASVVLTVLAAQYHGHHNGSLTLTARTAAEYGIGGTHPLHDSLRELQTRGLITMTRPGTWIPRLSAMYALDWLPVDEPLPRDRHDVSPPLMPSDRWRRWPAMKPGRYWADAGVAERRRKRQQRARGGPRVNHPMTLDHVQEAE